MTLKVFYNASPLLLPQTGIGQYTYQLLKQIRAARDVSSRYFYLARWSEHLLETSGQAAKGATPKLWMIKNAIRKIVPQSLEYQHHTRQFLFRLGSKGQGPAVYHEPNFIPFACDLPTLVTVHDLSILRYPETHPQERVKHIGGRLPGAIEKSSFVLADSEFTRQEILANFAVSAEKIVTVLLAAGKEFAPTPQAVLSPVLSHYGLEAQQYLLAVGTLEPRKNMVTALKAFAALPASLRARFPLVLVGLRGWLNEELDKLMSPMVARGEVRTLGFVPGTDLPALYTGAAAFVYPSLYEGFGLPPLEAMACGTAVITSNRASLPEVVGDAAISLEALDVDALRNAMVQLLEDPEERHRLGQAGIIRSREFSWERCGQETLALYKRAAGL